MNLTRPTQDRRRHPRAPGKDLPLTLQTEPGQALRVRDVSRSGVCFFCEKPIAVMTRVGFSLEFPAHAEQPKIEGEGVVVRCERLSSALAHYEVAVFFNDLDEASARRIDGFVAEHFSESEGDAS